MKILQPIQHFFKQYTTFPDRMFIALSIFGLIAGAGLILLNQIDFHFTTVMLFATHVTSISWLQCVVAFFFGFLFLFYGIYIQFISPRSSTFIWGMGLLFWGILVNLVLCNGIQATPFPPIDHTLVNIDRWIGINTPALMLWTHDHTYLHSILHFVYNTLVIELFAIPIVLSMVNARKALGIFFIAELSSFFIGAAIYFFFPTIAPSGIFHSPYFSHAQEDTSLRFYQVHHFLKTTSVDGGLIAFPSFHVIWVILLTYACRAKKIFFYPIAIYNVILIVSTVLLGWHYFTDVLGGIALAIGGIVFGERVYKVGI